METILPDVLRCLQANTAFDLAGLRPDMALRRIQLRMRENNIASPEDYLRKLVGDRTEQQRLLSSLTIKVSSFFRMPLAWDILRYEVLPQLLEAAGPRPLRVWSAGCSTGEEVYTLLLLLNELMESQHKALLVHCFATDIDSDVLEIARAGVYRDDERFDNMPLRFLRRGFERQGESWRVIDALREQVNFSVFNLLSRTERAPSESLFGEFDIVMCRNVMIYYREPYHSIILSKVTQAVRPGGWLLLGEAERLPLQENTMFREMHPLAHMYKRKE